MKKMILFAMAASLALSSATAAKTSKTASKTPRPAVTKPNLPKGDKDRGYADGYAVVIDDKTDPFSAKSMGGSKEYSDGYKNGLKQRAIDEGIKVGKTISGGFDYGKIPNWKKSQKACEYWVEGYNSMHKIALEAWKAGYAAIEKESDACKVPAAYSAQSALYKANYQLAHKNARKIFDSYVKAYKEGYASKTEPEPEIEGDGAPMRGPDPNRDWYTAMFDDLSSSVSYSFWNVSEGCGYRYREYKGLSDGYADKKAGKKPRF